MNPNEIAKAIHVQATADCMVLNGECELNGPIVTIGPIKIEVCTDYYIVWMPGCNSIGAFDPKTVNTTYVYKNIMRMINN